MGVLDIGPAELILVLVIVLIVFGPGKLPELGAGLGRGLREFRRATSDLTAELTRPFEEAADRQTSETAALPPAEAPSPPPAESAQPVAGVEAAARPADGGGRRFRPVAGIAPAAAAAERRTYCPRGHRGARA